MNDAIFIFRLFVSLIIGPLSLCCSLTLVIIHLKVHKLRAHPGSFLICQYLGQCLFDIQWVTGFDLIQDSVSEDMCKFLGILAVYGIVAIYSYNLVLSIEILRQSRSLTKISAFRKILLHLLCNCFGLAYAIYLSFDDQCDSREVVKNCYLTDDTMKFLVASPLIFLSLISLGIVLHTFRKRVDAKLKYHLILIIVNIICLTPLSIQFCFEFVGISEPPLWYSIVSSTQIGYIMCSSMGIATFMVRMAEKKMRVQILNFFMCRKTFDRDSDNADSHQLDDLAERFNVLTYSEIGSYQMTKQLDTYKVWLRQTFYYILSGLSHVYNAYEHIKSQVDQEPSKLWEFVLEIDDFKNSSKNGYIRVELTEYHPFAFSQLRAKENLTNASILESIDPNKNIDKLHELNKNMGGRGLGCLFFTIDYSFIVKSITRSEYKSFCNIFDAYMNVQTNQLPSMFARLVGIFMIKVKNHTDYFVLMENISKSTVDPLRFDLKGSDVNRKVTSFIYSNYSLMPTEIVYKDTDFHLNVKCIHMNKESRRQLLEALERDTEILEHGYIMDYSLLVSIQELYSDNDYLITRKYRTSGRIGTTEVMVYIGLIDYFQVYSFPKKLERFCKVLCHPRKKNEVSVISPSLYRARFLRKMRLIFADADV